MKNKVPVVSKTNLPKLTKTRELQGRLIEYTFHYKDWDFVVVSEDRNWDFVKLHQSVIIARLTTSQSDILYKFIRKTVVGSDSVLEEQDSLDKIALIAELRRTRAIGKDFGCLKVIDDIFRASREHQIQLIKTALRKLGCDEKELLPTQFAMSKLEERSKYKQ